MDHLIRPIESKKFAEWLLARRFEFMVRVTSGTGIGTSYSFYSIAGSFALFISRMLLRFSATAAFDEWFNTLSSNIRV